MLIQLIQISKLKKRRGGGERSKVSYDPKKNYSIQHPFLNITENPFRQAKATHFKCKPKFV